MIILRWLWGAKSLIRLAALLSVLVLSACSQQELRDSGPARPIDFSGMADAVPKTEPRTRAGNKSPYEIFGVRYQVMADSKGFRQQGPASWYGKKFHGRNTSNGEVYDMYAMTAAHKTLPIPSYVRVSNHHNGRSVVVRVNDRGPFHGDRIIDLSYAAASKLGFTEQGTAMVSVEAIDTGNPPLRHAGVFAPAPVVPAVAPQPTMVKPPVAKHKPVAPRANLSYLQVAALSQRDGAERLLQRLRNAMAAPMRVQQDNGVFRVQIGPLQKIQDLAAVKQVLQALNLGSGFVVND